jgi:hypothetical protein
MKNIMLDRDKLPNETQDSSSVFMLGMVLGASVPLLFLALGA